MSLWTLFIAVAGTVVLGAGSVLVAAPVGVGVALWARWLSPPALRRALRSALAIGADVPSICVAVALLLVPVSPGWQAVGLAGFGLAITIAPVICVQAYNALDRVPSAGVLQTIALGATPTQAVAAVVLPRATPGLLGACLVGLARAFGETVVVLVILDGVVATTLTRSAVVQWWADSPLSSLPSLSIVAALAAGTWMLGRRFVGGV